ncbi:MAG TPA: hypothetical protein VEX86_20280 [Longimicrobium sp.]|nr:hypothetical protein [Longimicrobium sp.]
MAPAAVAGRVIAAGGGDVRGVRVYVRAGVLADSAEVDSAGRFAVALPVAPVDSLVVWVDAADPEARAFHPARLRLRPRDVAREHEIVLVPLRWTIAAGRYAGREVEMRLARAFSGACAACSGFFRRAGPGVEPGRTRLHGWPAERFPLRVAFDREWSGENVTARDSAAFWREAAEMEEAFGADIFRPANFPDAAPRDDGGPEDVILVWFDPDMRGIGGIGTSVSNGDEIEYGDMRLDRGAFRDAVGSPGLVAHELMHTLGFGHTCAWRSVVADTRRCPNLRAPTATEEDVAYVQLAAEIRALLRQRGGRWALEAALAAMEAPNGSRLAVR